MKVTLFLLIAICFVASALALAPSIEEKRILFTSFIKRHGRYYSTTTEFNRRLQIFSENIDLIHSHNIEAAAGAHSFTLAATKFADFTNEEYRRMLKTHASSRPHDDNRIPFVFSGHVKDLPTEVDWRTKGVVTGVKDQGQCGSCWSFSAVGSMEGAHALATGQLASFSEQNLVDCVNNGADDCNTGGEMQDGFSYAIAHGIEGETDYPYCACSKKVCKFDASKVRAKFTSYQNVTVGDESALQAAVADRPGVSIAIDASSIFFQLYGGGVYDDATCKNKVEDLDHGVLAVGYGSYEGKDYWLVKNSWGGSWGLSGYIMMSRNKSNQCGVATDASFILA